jgi:undecaprenyl-diphosphatase
MFKGVSYSSYVLGAAIPISTMAIGLIKMDKSLKVKSFQMMAGLGLAISLSYLAKHTFNRARPSEKYAFIFPKLIKDSPSFPSGHTSVAFETATSLSLNFPKWYVIMPAYAWAGAVGYSRMYLGVHYPSDVLASSIIGCGSAWLTWILNQRWQRHKLRSSGTRKCFGD